jgi:hypothetical protein
LFPPKPIPANVLSSALVFSSPSSFDPPPSSLCSFFLSLSFSAARAAAPSPYWTLRVRTITSARAPTRGRCWCCWRIRVRCAISLRRCVKGREEDEEEEREFSAVGVSARWTMISFLQFFSHELPIVFSLEFCTHYLHSLHLSFSPASPPTSFI